MCMAMTGQLFYAGDRAGPMFAINTHQVDGPFIASVISHLTGEVLAKQGGFKTIGEAVEFCYGCADW